MAMSDGVKEALKEMEKKYGKGAIRRLGDQVGEPFPSIATGLPSLDYGVIGIGGFPCGRITELFGPEAGGKTLLALRVVAQAQREGRLCAFVDAEHAFDPNWANLNGVNVDDLLVTQPDYGEQALDIAQSLISSGGLGVLIIDSVAALVPKAELEGEFGESKMGVHARLMSQAMRMLTGITSTTGTVVIFINQLRMKIGVVYGNPEVTTGGNALKFYASLRLDVRKIEAIKEGDEVIGNKVKVKCAKNKLAKPFNSTELRLLFASGFDEIEDLVTACVNYGVIVKSGAFYSLAEGNGDNLAQGKEKVTALVREDETLKNTLQERLRAKLK